MKRFLIFLLLIGGFIFFSLISKEAYFNWFISSKYSIDSVKVEQIMDEDGNFKVHEIITYNMRKPFRGLYRYIPPERYVKISDVKIWTEGIEAKYVDLQKTERSFEAKVWLVPFQSTQQLDPKKYNKVVLHVSYTAKYIFEVGEDVAQVFRQFWGPDWEAPVKNIEAIFRFPNDIKPLKIYTHPKAKIESIGNTYEIKLSRLPPYSFGEVRFIFKPIDNIKYSVKNLPFNLNEIEKFERDYTIGHLKRIILLIAIYIIFIFLIVLIYLLLGREHKISYQSLYERELPYKDPPDIVNSIVKNLTGKVDQDGMASVIMDLYKKNYIDFTHDKEKKTILIKKNLARNDLSNSEEKFFDLLLKFSKNGIFDFEALKKDFKKSVTKARRFTSQLRRYESTVAKEVKKRRYLSNTGNYLAKTLSIVLMVLAIFLKDFIPRFPYNDVYDFYFMMSLIYWISGSIILVLPRDVFGKWSKIGREYYLKWKNFEKFLTDFSLLSEHPPESLIIWEDYLVYATALGIADKVEKNLQKLIPKEIWEEESGHPFIYSVSMVGYLRSNLTSLRNTATSVSSNSSSHGGSGGGGGGAF